MTNLDLVSYNKMFLYAVVGAPGSAHDSRLLKESSIFIRDEKETFIQTELSFQEIYATKSELGTVRSYSFPGQQKGTKKIHLKSSNDILIKGLVEQELLLKMHMKC